MREPFAREHPTSLQRFLGSPVSSMRLLIAGFVAMTSLHPLTHGAEAQAIAPSPLVAITTEPPAKLFVSQPLAEPLLHGRAFIQYRTENLRVVPVFGAGALDVSPRIGHVHITVDDAPWHFVDASGETVVLVGLPPGAHTVLFELADPTHRVITSKTVSFTIPASESSGTRNP